MKHFRQLLLAALVVLVAARVAAYDFRSGGLCYDINPDGMTVTLVQDVEVSNRYSGLTTVNIPSSVTYYGKTYVVTAIGKWAFLCCESLRQVTVPASVQTISESAFHKCKSLKKVELANGLKHIGRSAFSYCVSLKEIKIPNSVYEIGGSALADCDELEQIDLSNSLTMIPSWFCSGCPKLKTVNAPQDILDIEEGAFAVCPNLKYINLDKVQSIDERAFYKCSSLKELKIRNLKWIRGSLAFGQCSSLTITVPANVEKNAGTFADVKHVYYTH